MKYRKVSKKSEKKYEKKSEKKSEKNYFKPGNRLNEEQKKYCRCVYHVAAQQTLDCLRRRKWTDNDQKCYNPYAICSKSVQRKGRVECYKNTNLRNLPPKEQKALAALKNKKLKN